MKQQRESIVKEGLDKTFPVKKTEKGWLMVEAIFSDFCVPSIYHSS